MKNKPEVLSKSTDATTKYSHEETKKVLFNLMHVPSINAEQSLKEFGENTIPKLVHSNAQDRKKVEDEITTKGRALMQMFEADTHWNLAEIFDDRYRGMVVELTSEIIKEYLCTTHAEKMMAEIVVNAYTRVLDASRRLNNDLGKPGTEITKNKTKHLLMLSKLHDSSNRQFLTALLTLKQLKAPNIEMNIKANTAYIAQNQQVNTGVLTDKKI